ncbi:hypothetical protein DFH08DRAFT_357941 [Mycena albidolilacea]|uniref:Uncharacterized protein n=1 Tax=Mycena albidolilacea TaxID=1033008 RepID=A0AAD6ZH23_9AGAR|nr:hypothetical protein DFH08DRAFT_357941 [Mycena albidolilacea]
MATAPAAPTAKFSFKAPLPPSASAYGSSSTLPSSAFSSGFNNNAAAASQAPGTLPTAGKQRRMSLTLPSSPRVVPARHFWDDTSVPYADSPSSSASAFGTLDPEDDGDAGETGEELEGGEGEGVGVDRGANEDNDTTEKEREEKRGEKERAQDAGTGTGHKPGRKIPEAYYLTHYRNARARLQPVPPVLPAPSLHTEPVFSAESRRARRCDVAKTGFSLHTTPGFSAASRRARRRDVGFGGSASSRGSSSHTTSGISRNASQSSLDRFSEAASGDSSFSSSPLKDWNLPSPLKDWNPPSLWKDWNLPSPWKDWNLPSYKLPIHRRILQELDLTGSVTKLDTYPIDSGGSADIYEPQELEQTSRVCLISS